MGSCITLIPTNKLYEIFIIHTESWQGYYLVSSVYIQIILTVEANIYCSFTTADKQSYRSILDEFVATCDINWLKILFLDELMLPNLALSTCQGQLGGWSRGSGHGFGLYAGDQNSHPAEDSCFFINGKSQSVTLTHTLIIPLLAKVVSLH